MYYKELEKYLKEGVGNPQSMTIKEISTDPSNKPMAKIMEEYFNIEIGDLISDLIGHKNKSIIERIDYPYHQELERIYIKMINVLTDF
jgi:hypothetical protein